jgi:hypothetical protein
MDTTAGESPMGGSHFADTQVTLGEALRRLIGTIEGEQITLRELLVLIGEQGMLFFCTVLTLPFLLPVSIPGVSTVFGLVIILIGIGVTFNRVPWLPAKLMDRSIRNEHLVPTLEKGVQLAERMQRWLRPRLMRVTSGTFASRVNGLALTFSGVLLLFPLSFIPFSNTLPALAILFLALGMLQRDGYFVLVGYLAMLATIIYFAGLALAVVVGGQSLLAL